MSDTTDNTPPRYTCNEYREEMILAALQRTLMRSDLTAAERKRIESEIIALEKAMGL